MAAFALTSLATSPPTRWGDKPARSSSQHRLLQYWLAPKPLAGWPTCRKRLPCTHPACCPFSINSPTRWSRYPATVRGLPESPRATHDGYSGSQQRQRLAKEGHRESRGVHSLWEERSRMLRRGRDSYNSSLKSPGGIHFSSTVVLLASMLRSSRSEPLPTLGLADDIRLLEKHRVGAAVVRRHGATRRDGAPFDATQRLCYRAAARVAVLKQALESVAEALGGAGIRWTPIKGGDLAFRVYDQPEDRQCGDLDVLVAEDDRELAVAALERSGWLAAHRSTVVEQSYLRDEAYCQALSHPLGGLLEVHFRLWGAAPVGLAAEVLAAAQPDSRLGRTGARISLEHAFALAAFHAWAVTPPRPLATWWDLERICEAGGKNIADGILDTGKRWSLHLPIAMAADAAASLWHLPACIQIARELGPELRWAERIAFAWTRRFGADATPYSAIVLARLVARRPSRHGWRSVWRHLVPHPALRKRARTATAKRG